MNSCIEWSKGLSHNGYGLTTRGNKTYRAHRLAYCEAHGLSYSDIKGQVVRHKCDNPKCVNPQHLELGSHTDNMRDMVIRGRSAKGLANGAGKLTPRQVEYIRAHYKPRCRYFGTVALGKKFNVSDTTIGRVVRGIYHRTNDTAEYGVNMMNKVDVA